MIVLVVEGPSDQVLFEHILYQVLGQAKSGARTKVSRGISNMLTETLPDACKLLDIIYTKVIAIFDRDEMHRPYTRSKTHIQRLQEILNDHPKAGGFQIHDNLENLIEICLPVDKRHDFRERAGKSKVRAAQWALKYLNETELKPRVADLEASLRCNLRKVFV